MQIIIENFLEKNDFLSSKYTYLTAFSGGADSLSLLDNLYKIAKIYNIKLAAMHVNHNWRGAESAQEMEFCKKFCEEKGIKFFSTKLDENVKQTELAAREARQNFFLECASKFHNPIIFTGHTASDNMETIIFRISKGTGLQGLQGILPVNKIQGICFCRPLLNVSRNDTISYCNDNNLKFNNDSSNKNLKYKRNFIRYEIIPKMKEINKNSEEAINKLAHLASIHNKILEEYLAPIRLKVCKQDHFITSEFLKLSQNVQQQLIYEMLSKNIPDYSYRKVTDILDIISQYADSKSGSRFSVSDKLWLFVNKEEFYLIDSVYASKNQTVEICHCGEFVFGEYIFSISEMNEKPQHFPLDKEYTAYVDLNCYKNNFKFVLRNRNDGDIICPLGMSGKTKLKKYLNSKAVPLHERNQKVLFCKENEVLWVAGLGINNKIKTVQNPTHMLKLQKR